MCRSSLDNKKKPPQHEAASLLFNSTLRVTLLGGEYLLTFKYALYRTLQRRIRVPDQVD